MTIKVEFLLNGAEKRTTHELARLYEALEACVHGMEINRTVDQNELIKARNWAMDTLKARAAAAQREMETIPEQFRRTV